MKVSTTANTGDAQEQSSSDPHKPLRDDVRLLGEVLGETLRAQEGAVLFETVERVRALAKNARAGQEEDFGALRAELRQMPVTMALPVARAFAHFLTLANIAEQHHRVRRRRAHRRDPASRAQRGSCQDAFERLIASGLAPDRLHAAVCSLRIELVLTAHPTEVMRRTMVEKHNRIATALGEHERADLAASERDEVVAELRREVATAWGTRDVRPDRPTPLDEVRSALVLFEQSLWHALPRYLREVDRALLAATGRGLPLDVTPLRFAS